MNIINLKAMLESADYLVYYNDTQEVIQVHELPSGELELATIDSATGINTPNNVTGCPDDIEGRLTVYKLLDSARVADLLGDDTCSSCGRGSNTVCNCTSCGSLICQDCHGVHICDPDDSHENYMRDLREDPITGDCCECGFEKHNDSSHICPSRCSRSEK